MRLIDADEMAECEYEAYTNAQRKVTDGLKRKVNYVVHEKIRRLIADAPEADVASVVRCKDCVHRSVADYGTGKWSCDLRVGFHDLDWFCADGERGDEDD